ncbi:protein MIS12 homolog [Coffea eugenioides]|uniref:Protein MIS12 homolog n=1 Tax=Coffea arabica TaxID=13443 RepID=A0A6P6X2I0_COFAR|nr:protein MIS12 homolog [Coffea eugenioides]
MEGSESEAIFESLNLNPQLFINEVLNCVDDLVDEAFTFFNQQASAVLKTDGTDRSDDLTKGVASIRNIIQSSLEKRLSMWEKYCLRHCFVVPEGFSLPKANGSSNDTSMDLDTVDDSELDKQLDSLRDKLILVGKESAQLNSEIQSLERQSDLINSSAASIHEALQLYEKHSMDDMLKELIKYSSEFHAKVDKLRSSRFEDIEHGRAERIHMLNGDISKANRRFGLFNAKIEELQELLDDMNTR